MQGRDCPVCREQGEPESTLYLGWQDGVRTEAIVEYKPFKSEFSEEVHCHSTGRIRQNWACHNNHNFWIEVDVPMRCWCGWTSEGE